ncbi:MAG: hypothetical protein LBJ89_04305 [Holosporales bacterium]|jgi:hypothetical protein|nr:hypothetical protein [Holosporales bacterium]
MLNKAIKRILLAWFGTFCGGGFCGGDKQPSHVEKSCFARIPVPDGGLIVTEVANFHTDALTRRKSTFCSLLVEFEYKNGETRKLDSHPIYSDPSYLAKKVENLYKISKGEGKTGQWDLYSMTALIEYSLRYCPLTFCTCLIKNDMDFLVNFHINWIRLLGPQVEQPEPTFLHRDMWKNELYLDQNSLKIYLLLSRVIA